MKYLKCIEIKLTYKHFKKKRLYIKKNSKKSKDFIKLKNQPNSKRKNVWMDVKEIVDTKTGSDSKTKITNCGTLLSMTMTNTFCDVILTCPCAYISE